MKKKDFIMVNGLFIFEQGTPAKPSEVNKNFEFILDAFKELKTTVENEITNGATTLKTDLLKDIQAVSDSRADLNLSNLNKGVLTSALMPDYSQPTARTLATEYIAETDLFLTCTDISSHDDYYYKLFLDYKDVKTEFSWGGYSDEPDNQRDFIAINIPKNTKFKITGYNRNNKESTVPKGTITTFPFIG
jgi:hypothetical protein